MLSVKKKFTLLLKQLVLMMLDVFTINGAFLLVMYITSDGKIIRSDYFTVFFDWRHMLITNIMALLVFFAFGLYRSVWRFAGAEELIRCNCAVFVTVVLWLVIDRTAYDLFGSKQKAFMVASYMAVGIVIMLFVAGFRMIYSAFRRVLNAYFKRGSGKNRILIIGAGYVGSYVINQLRSTQQRYGIPVAALDDNVQKHNRRVNEVLVYGPCSMIPEIVEKKKIDTIVICIPSASQERKNELIKLAMSTNCEVLISPSVEDFLEDANKKKTLRRVEISDLLSRKEVSLDRDVCKYLSDTTVLVTGGGGSIGSEICRQVARYNPASIIVFDIYENNAYELENYLNSKYGTDIKVYIRIGTVRDIARLREVFDEFRPSVVFHAAAHKHVPLMEDSPCEAVKNNVFGTYNTAVVANEFGVKRFVLLSTDKAVNPTNVMGTTKRITELIIQMCNQKSTTTKYAAVRFGNVLGSNGSVIPLFQKQIESGGPVLVTHPEITRYFMTIPEAAQLVAQAGGLANGGEIFVLDMGEPVKIADLAKNLIRLSGYTLDEIQIEFTGLRPGEKLYEELALESEITQRSKTQNDKIYVTTPTQIDIEKLEKQLADLRSAEEGQVRQALQAIVPNYSYSKPS